MTDHHPDPNPTDALSLRAQVYETLRHRLITGEIGPEDSLSTRAVARDLAVSQMPVRDALARLAAEGALSIRARRRMVTPPMTPARFEDLLACRILLESEAAVLALPFVDDELIARMHAHDLALEAALENGDFHAYMRNNHAFHFTLYRANARTTLNGLTETLWLQFGPFMRAVYSGMAHADMADQHHAALDALRARDPEALRRAIAADVHDGMTLIGERALVADTNQP